MITEPAGPLAPPQITVHEHYTGREERDCATRAEALAWAVATAERYPSASQVDVMVRLDTGFPGTGESYRWIARVDAQWSYQRTGIGPPPRDLEDVRTALAYIDEERYTS